ncbi:hypothetical protein N9881_00445 [bacterium]|nr:hypothetical protein [bacterium]
MLLGFLKMLVIAVGTVVGALIVGIACGLPVSFWISQKMADFLSFLPTEKFRKPTPQLGKAATLAMNGKIYEAAAEYESFLQDHPESKELYFYLVELAAGPLEDPGYVRNILERAEGALEYQSDVEALREHARAVQKRELIPLKHLNWCSCPQVERPQVAVPEILKGRFIPESA